MKKLKFLLLAVSFMSVSSLALAQAVANTTPNASPNTPSATPTTTPPTTTPSPTPSTSPALTPTTPSNAFITNNNANQFAEQSGAIAGTAQACGQDISVLNSRTMEVITLLTKNPADQQQAIMVYQKALANSQANQARNPVLKCSDVISSYNSLPILKDDYKQTVLPAMAQLGAGR